MHQQVNLSQDHPELQRHSGNLSSGYTIHVGGALEKKGLGQALAIRNINFPPLVSSVRDETHGDRPGPADRTLGKLAAGQEVRFSPTPALSVLYLGPRQGGW